MKKLNGRFGVYFQQCILQHQFWGNIKKVLNFAKERVITKALEEQQSAKLQLWPIYKNSAVLVKIITYLLLFFAGINRICLSANDYLMKKL